MSSAFEDATAVNECFGQGQFLTGESRLVPFDPIDLKGLLAIRSRLARCLAGKTMERAMGLSS